MVEDDDDEEDVELEEEDEEELNDNEEKVAHACPLHPPTILSMSIGRHGTN